MNKLLLTSFFLLTVAFGFSQTGRISGTIIDSKTGETLPGAMASIEGTNNGAIADFDGKFTLSKVAIGKATLVISYISYDKKIITDIEVKANDVTDVNVMLDPSTSKDLQEVEVIVTLNKENNTALVLQQKNNASVSDGISAETIKRTPDRNTSDVLKRISGASIQENKFAIIRGMNDRYNAAYINGAPLPSSESDRKAFAFDIFPSEMLDNLVILKTATPETPGEFAGGIININTKSIPEKNFQSIAISGGYNTLSTFKDFKTYDGGKYDWLGLDDGTRGLPKDLPNTQEYEKLSIDERASMAKLMTPSWALKNRKALPQMSLQYSIGRNMKLFKREFGVLFALSYRNNFSIFENTRREFEEQGGTDILKKTELVDTVYSQTILNSTMLNLAYKLNENNQLSLKTILSINSDDRVNVRKGGRDLDFLTNSTGDPIWEKATNFWFTQNTLLSSQLEGTHLIPKQKIKIKYVGGYNEIYRTIPNMRRLLYQKITRDEADTSVKYFAVVQNNGTIPTAAGNMFWATTSEKIYSGKYDIAIPANLKNIKTEFKVGGMHQFRDRTFQVRNVGFSRYRKTSAPSASFNSGLLFSDPDTLFAPNHLGLMESGTGGFKLDEATKSRDSYTASSVLHAGFAMFDTRIYEKLRLVGGIRIESYKQRFTFIDIGSTEPQVFDTTVVDPLPSLNIIYSLTEKLNIRASYYRTVSRPEFRELAPFAFYNFLFDNILSGNPYLKRATIDNFDLRFELYPGAGQLISVSGFYKEFENPIELVNRPAVSGGNELYYTNVPRVQNYGLELEYRFKLSVFTKNDSNIFLNNTTLFTNLALIKSKVDVSKIIGAIGTERPLQGQSPYLVNAGIMFNHPKQNWTASASYNIVGRRIYIVGNVQEPDVWENHRHVVDFQLTKIFKEKLELKLNVRDILAQKLLFYQDINGNQKYDKDIDSRWQETTFGQTITLGVSYKF